MRVWRIVKEAHVQTAFDGEGARRFGGRWNSPGFAAIYVSSSKALALLEVLVHLDSAEAPKRWVGFRFELPEDHVEIAELPAEWRRSSQRVGDEWLRSGRAAALAVPSLIVPEESNYLLNPSHPGFARLNFGEALPFVFDPRLF